MPNPLIEKKIKELKQAGLGGLALVHVRTALTEIYEAGKKEGFSDGLQTRGGAVLDEALAQYCKELQEKVEGMFLYADENMKSPVAAGWNSALNQVLALLTKEEKPSNN